MTIKRFWDDPYRRELETRISGVEGDRVTVAETIFYAESGGQEGDRGEAFGVVLLDTVDELLHVPGSRVEHGSLQFLDGGALDDVQGVDPVALGLRHRHALGVGDSGVQVDVLVGQRPIEMEARKVHSGDPEEKDVLGGRQH